MSSDVKRYELAPLILHRCARDEAAEGLYVRASDYDALVTLLKRLIDIEGPQPGDVQWFKDVQAALLNAGYAPSGGVNG
jgi:hypothetical protein